VGLAGTFVRETRFCIAKELAECSSLELVAVSTVVPLATPQSSTLEEVFDEDKIAGVVVAAVGE
jgi:hypothetical protein